MGRDIGEQLVSLVQKMRAANLEELADKLDTYTQREVQAAMAKRNESKAERLMDQYESPFWPSLMDCQRMTEACLV